MSLVRKPCFTLLELLIVLFILAFATTLTGIKVKDAYEEQRFLTEVEQVVSHLQLAQDLMLLLQNDTTFIFLNHDSDHEKLCYHLKAENPRRTTLSEIVKKEYELKSIRGVKFEGEMIKKEEKLAMHFFSKGMAMTKGKLILSRQKDTFDEASYQIVLSGRPGPIKSEKYKPKERDAFYEKEVLVQDIYPKNLLEETHDPKAK